MWKKIYSFIRWHKVLCWCMMHHHHHQHDHHDRRINKKKIIIIIKNVKKKVCWFWFISIKHLKKNHTTFIYYVDVCRRLSACAITIGGRDNFIYIYIFLVIHQNWWLVFWFFYFFFLIFFKLYTKRIKCKISDICILCFVIILNDSFVQCVMSRANQIVIYIL